MKPKLKLYQVRLYPRWGTGLVIVNASTSGQARFLALASLSESDREHLGPTPVTTVRTIRVTSKPIVLAATFYRE